MKPTFRLALLALLLVPAAGHAQVRTSSAMGLEVPASRPPASGHWLTGSYVSSSYAPMLAPGQMGYGVQPYLRYVLGRGERARPFVQYNLSPYWVRAYGGAAPFGTTEADGGFRNPAFAPLPLRGPLPNGFGYNGYGGGLGSVSVGVPVRVGTGAVIVHVAGSLVSGLLH